MIEDIHARACLIAHHEESITRLRRRIETLRQDTTGPEWKSRGVEAIKRYDLEISTIQEELGRLQAETHGVPVRTGDERSPG